MWLASTRESVEKNASGDFVLGTATGRRLEIRLIYAHRCKQ